MDNNNLKTIDLELLPQSTEKSFSINDNSDTFEDVCSNSVTELQNEIDILHSSKKPAKRSHQPNLEQVMPKNRKIEGDDQVIIESETSSTLVIRALPRPAMSPVLTKEQSIVQVFSKHKDSELHKEVCSKKESFRSPSKHNKDKDAMREETEIFIEKDKRKDVSEKDITDNKQQKKSRSEKDLKKEEKMDSKISKDKKSWTTYDKNNDKDSKKDGRIDSKSEKAEKDSSTKKMTDKDVKVNSKKEIPSTNVKVKDDKSKSKYEKPTINKSQKSDENENESQNRERKIQPVIAKEKQEKSSTSKYQKEKKDEKEKKDSRDDKNVKKDEKMCVKDRKEKKDEKIDSKNESQKKDKKTETKAEKEKKDKNSTSKDRKEKKDEKSDLKDGKGKKGIVLEKRIRKDEKEVTKKKNTDSERKDSISDKSKTKDSKKSSKKVNKSDSGSDEKSKSNIRKVRKSEQESGDSRDSRSDKGSTSLPRHYSTRHSSSSPKRHHNRSYRSNKDRKSRHKSSKRRRHLSSSSSSSSTSKSSRRSSDSDVKVDKYRSHRSARSLQMGPLNLREEFLLETECDIVNPEEQLEESFQCKLAKQATKDKRTIAQKLEILLNKTKPKSEKIDANVDISTSALSIPLPKEESQKSTAIKETTTIIMKDPPKIGETQVPSAKDLSLIIPLPKCSKKTEKSTQPPKDERSLLIPLPKLPKTMVTNQPITDDQSLTIPFPKSSRKKSTNLKEEISIPFPKTALQKDSIHDSTINEIPKPPPEKVSLVDSIPKPPLEKTSLISPIPNPPPEKTSLISPIPKPPPEKTSVIIPIPNPPSEKTLSSPIPNPPPEKTPHISSIPKPPPEKIPEIVSIPKPPKTQQINTEAPKLITPDNQVQNQPETNRSQKSSREKVCFSIPITKATKKQPIFIDAHESFKQSVQPKILPLEMFKTQLVSDDSHQRVPFLLPKDFQINSENIDKEKIKAAENPESDRSLSQSLTPKEIVTNQSSDDVVDKPNSKDEAAIISDKEKPVRSKESKTKIDKERHISSNTEKASHSKDSKSRHRTENIKERCEKKPYHTVKVKPMDESSLSSLSTDINIEMISSSTVETVSDKNEIIFSVSSEKDKGKPSNVEISKTADDKQLQEKSSKKDVTEVVKSTRKKESILVAKPEKSKNELLSKIDKEGIRKEILHSSDKEKESLINAKVETSKEKPVKAHVDKSSSHKETSKRKHSDSEILNKGSASSTEKDISKNVETKTSQSVNSEESLLKTDGKHSKEIPSAYKDRSSKTTAVTKKPIGTNTESRSSTDRKQTKELPSNVEVSKVVSSKDDQISTSVAKVSKEKPDSSEIENLSDKEKKPSNISDLDEKDSGVCIKSADNKESISNISDKLNKEEQISGEKSSHRKHSVSSTKEKTVKEKPRGSEGSKGTEKKGLLSETSKRKPDDKKLSRKEGEYFKDTHINKEDSKSHEQHEDSQPNIVNENALCKELIEKEVAQFADGNAMLSSNAANENMSENVLTAPVNTERNIEIEEKSTTEEPSIFQEEEIKITESTNLWSHDKVSFGFASTKSAKIQPSSAIISKLAHEKKSLIGFSFKDPANVEVVEHKIVSLEKPTVSPISSEELPQKEILFNQEKEKLETPLQKSSKKQLYGFEIMPTIKKHEASIISNQDSNLGNIDVSSSNILQGNVDSILEQVKNLNTEQSKTSCPSSQVQLTERQSVDGLPHTDKKKEKEVKRTIIEDKKSKIKTDSQHSKERSKEHKSVSDRTKSTESKVVKGNVEQKEKGSKISRDSSTEHRKTDPKHHKDKEIDNQSITVSSQVEDKTKINETQSKIFQKTDEENAKEVQLCKINLHEDKELSMEEANPMNSKVVTAEKIVTDSQLTKESSTEHRQSRSARKTDTEKGDAALMAECISTEHLNPIIETTKSKESKMKLHKRKERDDQSSKEGRKIRLTEVTTSKEVVSLNDLNQTKEDIKVTDTDLTKADRKSRSKSSKDHKNFVDQTVESKLLTAAPSSKDKVELVSEESTETDPNVAYIEKSIIMEPAMNMCNIFFRMKTKTKISSKVTECATSTEIGTMEFNWPFVIDKENTPVTLKSTMDNILCQPQLEGKDLRTQGKNRPKAMKMPQGNESGNQESFDLKHVEIHDSSQPTDEIISNEISQSEEGRISNVPGCGITGEEEKLMPTPDSQPVKDSKRADKRHKSSKGRESLSDSSRDSSKSRRKYQRDKDRRSKRCESRDRSIVRRSHRSCSKDTGKINRKRTRKESVSQSSESSSSNSSSTSSASDESPRRRRRSIEESRVKKRSKDKSWRRSQSKDIKKRRLSKSRSNSGRHSKSKSKHRHISLSSGEDVNEMERKYKRHREDSKTKRRQMSKSRSRERKSRDESHSQERSKNSKSEDRARVTSRSKSVEKSLPRTIPRNQFQQTHQLRPNENMSFRRDADDKIRQSQMLVDSVRNTLKGNTEFTPTKDNTMADNRPSALLEKPVTLTNEVEQCILTLLNQLVAGNLINNAPVPDAPKAYAPESLFNPLINQNFYPKITPNPEPTLQASNLNFFVNSTGFTSNPTAVYPPICRPKLDTTTYPPQNVYQPNFGNLFVQQPRENTFPTQSFTNFPQAAPKQTVQTTPYVAPRDIRDKIPIIPLMSIRDFDLKDSHKVVHQSRREPIKQQQFEPIKQQQFEPIRHQQFEPIKQQAVEIKPAPVIDLCPTKSSSSSSSLSDYIMDMEVASPSVKTVGSVSLVKLESYFTDRDDLSSCSEFHFQDLEPEDPFQKYVNAPRPNYEHIVKTEVHLSAVGRRFEYTYLKSATCSCIPPNPDDIRLGKSACDEHCFNRQIKVECNRCCPVYDLCTNRRFQEQIYAPLEPFYCGAEKGWGVRALSNIQAGTFIIEYVGELIDFDEFLRRINQNVAANRHYLMIVQKGLYIDAGNKGNWSRFVNHSCDPNTVIEKWIVNGKTRIGFFAQKPIAADDEITIDYQFQQYGATEQSCYCRTSKCTGIMGKVNEKLQAAIRMNEIRQREELIQRIIMRDSLTEIVHVSEMITVIKESSLDRDTFSNFLELLIRTTSHLCLRTFIECGGLNVITSYLDSVFWYDWSLKLLYLQCLDHFKLKKRTLLKSGYNAAMVVEYWSENPRYEVKQAPEVDSLTVDSFNDDNETISDLIEPASSDAECQLQFILPNTDEPVSEVEKQVQCLALNIRDYFSDERAKFFIPKIKSNQLEFTNDLRSTDSNESKSLSVSSSVQGGDFVQNKKKKLKMKCRKVIEKLPKEEFRRLFTERYNKSLVDQSQVYAEVFKNTKQILSSVIIEEVNNLKQNEHFATMPIEFQNMDIDKILSGLNIVEKDGVLSFTTTHQEDENKSVSIAKSLEETVKRDQDTALYSTDKLPPNWRFCRCDNGRVYFYHIISKKTQWETPVYPWDAGENDSCAYDYGDSSKYQVTLDDIKSMYERLKVTSDQIKLQEKEKRRLERTIQKKLSLSAGDRNRIQFSREVFKAVKSIMKPYHSSSCRIGRVRTKEDMKYLCEKFADTIIGKEVKQVINLEDLELTTDVLAKMKSYITKYMSRQGHSYKRTSRKHKSRATTSAVSTPDFPL